MSNEKDKDNVIKIVKNSEYGHFADVPSQYPPVYGAMKDKAERENHNSTPSMIKRLLADYEYEESHGREEIEFGLNEPEIVIICCVLEKRMEEIMKVLQEEDDPDLQDLLRRYLRMHQMTYVEFRNALDLDPDETA